MERKNDATKKRKLFKYTDFFPEVGEGEAAIFIETFMLTEKGIKNRGNSARWKVRNESEKDARGISGGGHGGRWQKRGAKGIGDHRISPILNAREKKDGEDEPTSGSKFTSKTEARRENIKSRRKNPPWKKKKKESALLASGCVRVQKSKTWHPLE